MPVASSCYNFVIGLFWCLCTLLVHIGSSRINPSQSRYLSTTPKVRKRLDTQEKVNERRLQWMTSQLQFFEPGQRAFVVPKLILLFIVADWSAQPYYYINFGSDLFFESAQRNGVTFVFLTDWEIFFCLTGSKPKTNLFSNFRGSVQEFITFTSKILTERTEIGERQSVKEGEYSCHVFCRSVT